MYSKVEDKSQGKSKGCFVFQGQGLGLWVSRLGFRALGFKARVQGSGFQGQGLVFLSRLGFRALGFKARVQGLGFQGQGLGFWVSRLGFRALVFKARVQVSRLGFSRTLSPRQTKKLWSTTINMTITPFFTDVSVFVPRIQKHLARRGGPPSFV